MKKLLSTLLISFIALATFAQGGPYNRNKLTTNFYPRTYMLINDTSGTTAATSRIGADSSAVMIIRDTTRGVLLPRMTGAQAAAIADKSHNLLVVITDSVNSPLCMWDTLNSKFHCFATSTALNIDSFIAYNGLIKRGDTVKLGGELFENTEIDLNDKYLSFSTDSLANFGAEYVAFLVNTQLTGQPDIIASVKDSVYENALTIKSHEFSLLNTSSSTDTNITVTMNAENANSESNMLITPNVLRVSHSTNSTDTNSYMFVDNISSSNVILLNNDLYYQQGIYNFNGDPSTELSIYKMNATSDVTALQMKFDYTRLYVGDTSCENSFPCYPISGWQTQKTNTGSFTGVSSGNLVGSYLTIPHKTGIFQDSATVLSFDSAAAYIKTSYWDDTIRVNATKTVKDSTDYYYLGNQTIVGLDSVSIYATSPDPGTINYCIDCTGNGVTGRFVGYFGAAWRRFLFD